MIGYVAITSKFNVNQKPTFFIISLRNIQLATYNETKDKLIICSFTWGNSAAEPDNGTNY